MSRHQVYASRSIVRNEIKMIVLIFLLIIIRPEVTRARIPLDVNNGQGQFFHCFKDLSIKRRHFQ